MNPVLRARLCDISWLLDRKRGVLGTRAISSYVEIVRKSDAGELKWRFPEENEDGGLQHEAPTHLRRALQIGRSIGWDKAENRASPPLDRRAGWHLRGNVGLLAAGGPARDRHR